MKGKVYKGSVSFYSKKLKKVIQCRDGYYNPCDEKEAKEVEAYIAKTQKVKSENKAKDADIVNSIQDEIKKAKKGSSEV